MGLVYELNENYGSISSEEKFMDTIAPPID